MVRTPVSLFAAGEEPVKQNIMRIAIKTFAALLSAVLFALSGSGQELLFSSRTPASAAVVVPVHAAALKTADRAADHPADFTVGRRQEGGGEISCRRPGGFSGIARIALPPAPAPAAVALAGGIGKSGAPEEHLVIAFQKRARGLPVRAAPKLG
jgi:hypothetical protein